MSEKRLRRHMQTLAEGFAPVVFCVRCGSTKIDQNSRIELYCYDCHNSLRWDSSKFSVNRSATRADMRQRAADAVDSFLQHPEVPK